MLKLSDLEPVAGRIAHPGDLLGGGLERDAARVDPVLRQRARGQAHDVRLTPGQGQDPLTATTDHERRVRPLDGRRPTLVVGDRVVLAGEREGTLPEAALHDGDRFGQSGDPRPDRFERQADGVVLLAVPAGADPDVEATLAQDVERGHVLRQHGRVTQVVVEHERADPQGRGGGRDRRHRRDR